LEAHFPDITETQPELVAHHYTEAGISREAIIYWYKAGQRAIRRSAHVEATGHLTKGLAVVMTLPDTPERTQHELGLQLALGVALIATKGYGAPEVETVYLRARTLCQALGEMPRLLQVLLGLEAYYVTTAQLRRAHELAEQCLTLAQRVQHPVRLLNSHHALGLVLFHRGESTAALPHLEQGMTLYDAQPHHPRHNLQNPGVACRSYAAWALWWLGYPEQALQRGREALALAHALSHPYSLAYVLCYVAALHQYRREAQRAEEQAAAVVALTTEHDFPLWCAMGTWLYGWALAEQEQVEEGLRQICQAVTAWRATGAALIMPTYLATLAEVYGKAGQWEAAQRVLREALALVEDTGERCWEAELYRHQGELLRRQTVPDESQAEACFQQALAIARRQQAKSFELRTAMSLVRLWQQQGKCIEARELLMPIYGWFTEGFDTARSPGGQGATRSISGITQRAQSTELHIAQKSFRTFCV
jgi:predicted ATPase